MPEPTRSNYIRRFLAQVVAVLVVFTVAAFAGMYLRTESLLAQFALTQARSYVDLIVTTRAWNAHYEGVYVEKKPGVPTNPYLLKLGVDPDIRTTDGRVFTLRNPALMTREISSRFAASDGVTFGLTSLNPVDPANASDAWESAALRSFAAGAKESYATQRVGGAQVLRYMRPLVTEQACLKCHASQGYRVGDIRGGVSVTVPLTAEARILRENAVWLALAGLASSLVLAGLTLALVSRLSRRLAEAEETLVRMATTDELTDLKNRRFTLERLHEEMVRARREHAELALLSIDLDHFKSVNDSLGHPFGDAVLRTAADRMRLVLREYDIIGRVGGEEFLVVAPGISLAETTDLAERMRIAVADKPISVEDHSASLTVSIGATTVCPAPDSDIPAETLHALKRADDALYAAKAAGRNRVESRPGAPAAD